MNIFHMYFNFKINIFQCNFFLCREKERAEYMRREFKEQAEEQDEDQQLRNRGNNFMSGIFGDKSKYTTEFPKYDETVKDTPRPKSKRFVVF